MYDEPILLPPEPMAAPIAPAVHDFAARWAAGALALALFVGVTGAGARAATHFAAPSKPARQAAVATPIAPPPAPLVTAPAAPTEAAALDTGFAAGADPR